MKALAFGAEASALLRSAGIDSEDASQMVGVIASSRVGFDKAALRPRAEPTGSGIAAVSRV